MMGRVGLALGFALALAGAAEARGMRIPGTECSVFDRRPCVAAPDYWIGQDLRLTIASKDTSETTKPDHDLDTIRDLFAALRACWQPPAPEQAREGMQMSVRLSFRRNGDMIAPPRVTYTSPDAPAETRQTYRAAIDAALDRCAPLPLTKGLGGAIAGRPIAIRYIDDRDLEPKPDTVEHP